MSRRNYKQMGDKKLLTVASDLKTLDEEDRATVVHQLSIRDLVVPTQSIVPSGTKRAALTQLFMPMLATQSKGTDYSDADYASEPKLDGFRSVCYRTPDGDVQMFNGRNGSPYNNHCPYVDEALADVLPPDTCVDGELVGSSREQVQSVMFTQQTHVPTTYNPALRLVIFDILRLNGTDVRGFKWSDRRRLVEQIQINPDKQVSITPLLDGVDQLEQMLELGFEGIMLKRRSSKYTNGRSSNWVKLKPQTEMDCRILALPHDGNGSLAGLVGAIEFLLPDGQTGRASGMKMPMRTDMTHNPEKYIGKIAEFAYFSITKDGRLISPVFKRMRPDLEPA